MTDYINSGTTRVSSNEAYVSFASIMFLFLFWLTIPVLACVSHLGPDVMISSIHQVLRLNLAQP